LFFPASAAENSPGQDASVPVPTPEQFADYQQKLAAYNLAQQQYAADSKAYWDQIETLRKIRNAKRRNNQSIVLDEYVLTQPPVYHGPPKPINPAAPKAPEIPTAPAYVPVKADFLRHAADRFNFTPRQPSTEMEFKKAYAAVAAAAGITRDQAVRIYSFEAGGNGTYDVQAGLEYNVPGAHAISTALGYNQLLSANSVELLAEEGPQFIQTLTTRAAKLTGPDQAALKTRLQVLRTLVDVSEGVPDKWDEHVALGNKPEGLAIHALNLDVDIGPFLQTQKLHNSVRFAKAKGYTTPLTAAELEMMNLMGDGNGFDMITVPAAWRPQVPTSNFFEQGGYQDNSVVRKNNVISALPYCCRTSRPRSKPN
jgi:hypothetical protein